MFEVKKKFRLVPRDETFEVGDKIALTSEEVKAIESQLGKGFIEEVKKIDYNKWLKEDIQILLEEKEIPYESGMTKKDLISLLED